MRHTVAMLHLRITAPNDLTERVLDVVGADPAVSSLAVMRDASVRPVGDIVLADIPREAANEIVERLEQLDIPQRGSIHIEPVSSWLSEAGLEAEKATPGSSADAVVWAEVTQRAYDESELNWTYLSFMTLATLLASIAIILDSQILVIGAMVLGPGVRRDRGPGPRPGAPAAGAGVLRRANVAPGLRGRHRPDHAGGPGRSRPGLDLDRRCHWCPAQHGLHLHP